MATDHNFRIKNGLEVGGQLIVNSSGQLVVANVTSNLKFNDNVKALFGDSGDVEFYFDGNSTILRNTASSTGNPIYIQGGAGTGAPIYLQAINGTNGIRVETSGKVALYHGSTERFYTTSSGASITGDLAVSGNLNIAGEVNSTTTTVTDLEVTDKTITLGAGQTEANSGNSGIIIDGSNASMLWNETSGNFRFNEGIEIANGASTNQLRLTTETGTAQIADTFTDTTTQKSYIYFDAGTGSNDPGYIMHETSDSEQNEGVLHLAPSDDNDANDYVSIHGTNDPDCLRLRTNGKIETAGSYQLTLLSGSGDVLVDDGLTVGGTISTGNAALSSNNLTINNGSGYGTIELGGSSGAFIDLKRPGGDDYDMRIVSDAGTGGRIGLANGDFTIDSPNYINFDADGGNVVLLDAGDTFGRFVNSSGDFIIKSDNADNDIKFQGVDGSTTITPVWIDMSAAGRMHIDAQLRILNSSGHADIYKSGADLIFSNNTSAGVIKFWANAQERVRLQANGDLDLKTGGLDIGGVEVINSSRNVHVNSSLEIGQYGDTTGGIIYLNGTTASKRAEIACSNGNLHIDADNGNGIYLNWYGSQSSTSTAGTYFGNANAGEVARIDGNGNFTLDGNIISTSAGHNYIELDNSQSNTRKWRIYNGQAWNQDALLIYDQTADSTALTIETGKLGINRGAGSLSHTLDVGGSIAIAGTEIFDSGRNLKAVPVGTFTGYITVNGRYVEDYDTSGHFYLGNNDWSQLINNQSGVSYSATHQGMQFNNQSGTIPCHIPIDPNSHYRVKVRIKHVSHSSGSGRFYFGVHTLNENKSGLQSDQANSYNYGVAIGGPLTAGTTYEFEDTFSGYNATNAGDHNKFDPEGKYFDLIYICNYQGAGTTVIQSIEVERLPDIQWLGSKKAILDDSTSTVFTGSSTGIKMGSAAIWPTTGNDGSNSTSGTKDLGASSVKWKDLFISGAANVGTITTTGNINAHSNIISTGTNPLVLSANGGTNIELYNNGNSYYDANNHNFRNTAGNVTQMTLNTSKLFVGVPIQTNTYLAVTNTSGSQNILIGNQDSAGVNKPAMINGVNGYLRFGHGNSWSGSGGTFTEAMNLLGNNVHVNNSLYLSEYIYHTGDTDTYVRIQDNSWTFRTGGGDRLVIDNSTTTISNNLAVTGTIASGAISSEASTHYLGGIKIAAENSAQNYIAFSGTTGDQPGNYNHSYIGERIHSGTERSELLLVKFNDVEGASGTDRIRHIANNHVFDTYTSAISIASDANLNSAAAAGTFTTRMTIDQDGDIILSNSSKLKGAVFYEALNAGSTDATATSPRFYSPSSGKGALSAGGAARLEFDSGAVTVGSTNGRLNLTSATYSFGTSFWAGGNGYPGYQFTGSNTRFGFSSTTGVVDVYADGNFYATDNAYKVWHANDFSSTNISNWNTAYSNASQALGTTAAVTFATVNTGQGATEVHLMNQNVRTTDSPTFNGLSTNSDITFNNSGTTKRGIRGTMGDNDMWFIGGGATASNAGYLEIATGDDGQTAASAEYMYFSQYGPGSPWSGTLFRRHAMFDPDGRSIWNFHRTPTSNAAILADSSITINTRTGSHNYIQFRNDSDDGTHAGLVFTDNNHGGSVLFTNHSAAENTAGRADTLHLSGYQGVDIRSGTGSAEIPANKTRVARFATASITLDKNTSVTGTLGCSGNLTVSSSNTTGGGIILADDGDIVDLNDAYCSMRFSYGVRIFSANRGGSAVIALKNNGEIIANSNITAYGSASDIRLKENIETIKDPIDKVQKLRGVTFDYKKDGSRSTGLIAQELEEVLPEVVYETVDAYDDDNKYKAVRYGNIVGLLVEAIKEQQNEITELKELINKLIDNK